MTTEEQDTEWRGPVCAECKHRSAAFGWCSAEPFEVDHPGKFDHVSGHWRGRLRYSLCEARNSFGQCTTFEPKPPPSRPAPNPTRPYVDGARNGGSGERSGGEVGGAPTVAKPRSGGGGEHDDGRRDSDILAAGFGAAVAVLLLTAVTALVNCHAAQPPKAERCQDAAP